MQADLVRSLLQTAPGCRPFRMPSVLGCGLMILALKAALRVCGFGRTLRFMRRQVEHVGANDTLNIEVVRAAEHTVAMAGALYPGRALCLEQSLVLYYLLRRQGVAMKYCQGVQPHPFAAHAWVAYRGEVINDVAEHVKHFTLLPDQLP
jgi:hypothetical protein